MATTTLLFWNLLNNRTYMDRCVQEIDVSLPSLSSDEVTYSIATLEASLPYLRNCVKENYRLNPVFTMPLARRITSPAGLSICGSHFPQGVSEEICLPQSDSANISRRLSRYATMPYTTIRRYRETIMMCSTLIAGKTPRLHLNHACSCTLALTVDSA